MNGLCCPIARASNSWTGCFSRSFNVGHFLNVTWGVIWPLLAILVSFNIVTITFNVLNNISTVVNANDS